MKAKTKGLFDDIDSLLADFDSAIADTTNLQKPKGEYRTSQQLRDDKTLSRTAEAGIASGNRPTPSSIKDESRPLWRREVIGKMIADAIDLTEISIEKFCELLTKHAHHYNWQGLEYGEMIRGFATTGDQLDPLTAVCASELNVYVSLCVSDLAGKLLGLRDEDARLVAFICWNDNVVVLDRKGVVKLREQIVAAIKAGAKLQGGI